MNKILLMLLLCSLIAGCGGVKPRVVSNAGVIQYLLCEKAKGRITDMRRASFELPSVFRQAPCGEWQGFSYSLRSDSVSVSMPGVVANESTMEVRAVQTLRITGGYEIYANYLDPEAFFVDYKEYLSRRVDDYRLVTASWVSWSGGRCARFYSDNETELYSLGVLDYFCWENESGMSFPIHLHATQTQTPGEPPANLDKKFIEPVLSTFKVNLISPERLAVWSGERSKFCTSLKNSYDSRTNGRFADDLDRRRAIRFLRNCGYEMPNPVGVESWSELLMPNGKLLGQAVAGDNTLRRLSHEQFLELKETLMSLQPKRGDRPEVRIQSPTKDGKRLVVVFTLNGPYAGDWYKFPPDYTTRNGIGIRNDPALGEVIDVLIREDARIPLGLKIISDRKLPVL